MTPPPVFTDGRGVHLDRLGVAVPRGCREAIAEYARANNTTTADVVRKAVAEKICADGAYPWLKRQIEGARL